MAEQARKPGRIERNEGDVDKALAGADKVIEHEYYIPHFSHAPMEPPAADGEDQRQARPRCGPACKARAERAATLPSSLA